MTKRSLTGLKRMRRTAAILALCAGAVSALGVSAAHAEVTTNERETDVPFEVEIACANGGVGETATGTINLHVLITENSNANNFVGKVHFQPQGGLLIGEETGDTYHPTGVTQETFKESLNNGQTTFTYVNNYRIIGAGPDNNYLVHEVDHVTVNANGEAIVENEKSTME